MDVNKEKCKALKKIRKKLADTLGVDLQQRECTYEGKCSGTCPKCKQEEEQLNRAILAKSALAAGTVVATVGLTGCAQIFQPLVEGGMQLLSPSSTEEDLAGNVEYIPPEEINGGLEEIDLPEEEQEDEF